MNNDVSLLAYCGYFWRTLIRDPIRNNYINNKKLMLDVTALFARINVIFWLVASLLDIIVRYEAVECKHAKHLLNHDGWGLLLFWAVTMILMIIGACCETQSVPLPRIIALFFHQIGIFFHLANLDGYIGSDEACVGYGSNKKCVSLESNCARQFSRTEEKVVLVGCTVIWIISSVIFWRYGSYICKRADRSREVRRLYSPDTSGVAPLPRKLIERTPSVSQGTSSGGTSSLSGSSVLRRAVSAPSVLIPLLPRPSVLGLPDPRLSASRSSVPESALLRVSVSEQSAAGPSVTKPLGAKTPKVTIEDEGQVRHQLKAQNPTDSASLSSSPTQKFESDQQRLLATSDVKIKKSRKSNKKPSRKNESASEPLLKEDSSESDIDDSFKKSGHTEFMSI